MEYKRFDSLEGNVWKYVFKFDNAIAIKDAGYKNIDIINNFYQRFLENGYNVRVFNPAGQDDIGGGCGQLWYVQNWLKNKTEAIK